jgi:general secretion pathway protein G
MAQPTPNTSIQKSGHPFTAEVAEPAEMKTTRADHPLRYLPALRCNRTYLSSHLRGVGPGFQPAPATGVGTRQRGMTLVEIMIVLTIISAVMAFAAFNVVSYMKTARIKEAGIQATKFMQFVQLYFVQHGEFPESLEELTTEGDGAHAITDHVPADPWGNPYVYQRSSNGEFTVWSAGPDGQSGTHDDIGPTQEEDS